MTANTSDLSAEGARRNAKADGAVRETVGVQNPASDGRGTTFITGVETSLVTEGVWTTVGQSAQPLMKRQEVGNEILEIQGRQQARNVGRQWRISVPPFGNGTHHNET